MPVKPRSRCTNCQQLHDGTGRCANCRPRKAPTTARGLGWDHQQAAAHILATAVRCAMCGGPPTPWDPLTAGHIIGRQAGGTNDLTNYQAEHLTCNASKVEPGHHVTLIAGPPCAGKTTYAQQHAREGDEILDLDQIARDLGSTRYWNHDEVITRQANELMRAKINRLAARRTGRAWVIRSVPTGNARAALARLLRAEQQIVLLPPGHVLVERAMRRPQPLTTVKAINAWQDRYTQDHADSIISEVVTFPQVRA